MTVIGETSVVVRPETSGFAGELKKGITDALKNPLVIAGAAVAAAGATVAAFSKVSVDKFKEVASGANQLKAITGGTAEEMSRLEYAAKRTGVGTDALGAGLKKLGQNLTTNKDDLTKLGIKFTDTKGKLLPLNQSLANVADKFKTMPAGIEKNALAVQLFGKSGTDLIPILNKGKDGLAELAAQSDKYGLTLTQGNLDALKKYKAAQNDLKDASDGLKVQLGAALLPVLASVATSFTATLTPAITTAKNLIKDDLAPVLSTIATTTSTAFKALVDGFQDPSSLQNNIDGIKGIFTLVGADIKLIFDNALIAYGAFTDGFKDSQAVGDEVGALATAFAALGVGVRDALAILKDIGTFLLNHPKVVQDATIAVAGFVAVYKTVQFGKKTIDFVTTGVDTVQKAISGIASALSGLGSGTKEIAVKLTQTAGQSAAAGAAKGGGSALGEQGTNIAVGAIGAAFGNLFDLKALGPRISVFAKGFMASLGAALIATAGGLVAVGEAIVAFLFLPEVLIGAAVVAAGLIAFHFKDEILNFFRDTLPAAVGALPSLSATLADKGGELVQGFLDGAVDVFKSVLDFYVGIPNDIAFAIGFLGGVLFLAGKELVQGFFDGIKLIYENVKTFFIGLGDAVVALLTLDVTLLQKGQDLINGLNEGIQNAFVAVGNFFVNLASSVVDFVGDVSVTLYGKGEDLLRGLRDGILEIWQDPVKFFKELPGNIVGFVGDVSRTLYDKGKDIISGLKSGIEDLYDSAISKFRDLRGNVIGAVVNAGSWLIEAGKDIIKGLLNGIGQLYDSAVGKMRSLGGSIIDGFKKGAGISSPSKFMHGAGVNIVQGLMNGIDSLAPAAIDQMKNLVTAPDLSLTASGSSGGVAGLMNGGGPTYQIGSLTIQNTKTLQENLDELDRLSPVMPGVV